MKKKILICSLLVALILSIASTAFCISYDGSAVYSFNTGSIYFSDINLPGENHCTLCQVDIYGTYYPDREESWLIESGGDRRSTTQTIGAGQTANHAPSRTGSLKLHLVNHDYYGNYPMHAMGTYKR